MNKHLAITLSSKSVHYSVLKDEIVVNNDQLILEEDNLTKERLDEFHQNSFVSKDEFDEVSLAFVASDSTIVPEFVFNDSEADEIYKLCFASPKEKNEIDYNRISEESVVNIYSIPLWVKSFFILKYPRIVIQHAGSHMIKGALKKNAFNLKVSMNIFENCFSILITKHMKIEYYSFFDFMNAEDIIYHLTFTLNQKEMTNEKGVIEISNYSNQKYPEQLNNFISKLSELSKFKVEEVNHSLEKSQLLCV